MSLVSLLCTLKMGKIVNCMLCTVPGVHWINGSLNRVTERIKGIKVQRALGKVFVY